MTMDLREWLDAWSEGWDMFVKSQRSAELAVMESERARILKERSRERMNPEHKLYKKLLEEADIEYTRFKQARGLDLSYCAPEALPRIQSDQVKAVLMVLAKHLGGKDVHG